MGQVQQVEIVEEIRCDSELAYCRPGPAITTAPADLPVSSGALSLLDSEEPVIPLAPAIHETAGAAEPPIVMAS